MQQRADTIDLFAGDGEMSRLMQAHDWSATSLGPVEDWPQGLKTAVRIMLGSRYPMFIWWGRQLVNLYNDGYRPMLGQRHPAALGQPAAVIWSEIWDTIGPQTDAVLYEGRATWNEERLLILERNGYPEEAYFTFSYSPVPGDDGGVGGIFCALTEDTQRILGQRRLRTLRELSARTTGARTVEQACQAAADTLAQSPHDLPFALIYLLDGEGRLARLAGTTGLPEGSPACPPVLELSPSDTRSSCWPLHRVADTGQAELVGRLESHFGRLRCGLWPDPPPSALVLPVLQSGQDRLAGFLVAGISPRRAFDDDYRGFLEMLAGHVATAIANARAYEEERRRAEALAELDRAKTAFFSNVSHEFRTPLTLMLGPVEDALADAAEPPTPRQRERLEVAHRNALRLQTLVNTLLEFSRIEAGRVQASYEPVDLAALTADLASNFRSACEKAGLVLRVECAPLPEPVYVDREMWEKIVLNLLSNAFKYTLQGEIAVALRRRDGQAVLSVRDTGSGIPPDQMPLLFERFHRVAGARGRTQEGTGIGLALVKELAHLHGGEVHAESELGKGSVFTVTLPLGKSHLPADHIGAAHTLASTALSAAPYIEEALRWLPGASPSSPAHAAEALLLAGIDGVPRPPAPAPGERPRIVLADDNADLRGYLRRLLADRYEVTAVADGQAALVAAQNSVPELILSDVMMPRLDGFGLLHRLRADPRTREVPVILLSARAGEESRVEGLEAGADDYLVKPFSARELLARVSAHLQMARLRREASEALRQSEERFRQLAENINEVFWMTDRQTTQLLYISPAYERVWGRSFQSLYENPRSFMDAIHPEDRERVRTAVLENQSRGEQTDKEYRVVRPDGSIRWVRDRAFPVKDAQGKFYRLVGIVEDFTERKEAEEALKDANRRKDEFLATLAHELRNPLAPIRNAVELLRRGSGDGAVTEMARTMMERQLAQMVRLVDDLLDISRITQGKLHLRNERVELAAVVHNAVEASRPLIDAQAHELTVTLPPQPVHLEADPIRLAQVFSNLLNNAAKYTEKGGDIWLTAERQGAGVVVSVRDTGIGIAADYLPRLFEMFSQVEPALERSQGGLGIGLALVHGLVELHGGNIEAHSAGPGMGSEFTVWLPVVEAPAQAPLEASPGSEKSGAGRKCRILVADDLQDSADSLALMLRLAGHEVQTAHDGLEAVQAVAAFRPDVALLDIGMPRMNGYDAARLIRQQPWGQRMVLVALTGWGQQEDRRRTADAGFDHHVVKPVEPATLEELLDGLRRAKG
jgi:PAS domain S-box-containing protein